MPRSAYEVALMKRKWDRDKPVVKRDLSGKYVKSLTLVYAGTKATKLIPDPCIVKMQELLAQFKAGELTREEIDQAIQQFKEVKTYV